MKSVIMNSRPIAHVAREFGINEGTLGNWVATYRLWFCRPRAAGGRPRAAGGRPLAGLEFVEKLLTKLTSTDTTERNRAGFAVFRPSHRLMELATDPGWASTWSWSP